MNYVYYTTLVTVLIFRILHLTSDRSGMINYVIILSEDGHYLFKIVNKILVVGIKNEKNGPKLFFYRNYKVFENIKH